MKKIYALWVCILLALFCACGVEEGSRGSATSYSAPTAFATQDALIEHLSGSENKPQHLFRLNETLAGLPLERVELNYSNVYCTYMEPVEETKIPEPTISRSKNPVSSSLSSVPADTTLEDSFYFFDYISVRWSCESDGEAMLNDMIEKNGDVLYELEEHPGIYASDYLTEKGTLYGHHLYWVEDGCYFTASIPIQCYEEVLAEITGEDPIMPRVN